MSIAENANVVVGPMPGTPEWLAERRNHIGASEAAAACGLSPWKTPLHVYLEKRGLADPPEESAAMRLGKALEPVIAAEYTIRTGQAIVAPLPMMWRADTPWLAASLDAMTRGGDRPVELKATTWRRAAEFGEEGTDEVPDDYLMQVQHQMFVVDAESADLAVLLDGRTLRVYTIRRNDVLIERMIAAESELWDRIRACDPPPPDFSHRATPGLIKALYGVAEGQAIELPADARIAWESYEAIGEQIKALQEERDQDKARVMHAMGEASIALLGDGRELARSVVNVKEHTVRATSYVSLRARKQKIAKRS